jgi:putative sigma-54 modulation protein
MRIEIRGRNVPVGDELRARVEKRFEKVSRQVSPLARMEVEISEERNPSIRESHVAEANLYLKGVTLRARNASDSAVHAVNLVADEISRQVKRHRDKQRGRREAARAGPVPAPIVEAAPPPARPPGGEAEAAL